MDKSFPLRAGFTITAYCGIPGMDEEMSVVKFCEVKEEKIKGAHFVVSQLEDKIGKCRYVAMKLFDGEVTKTVNAFNPNRGDPEGLTVSMLESMGIEKDCILETDIVKNGNFYNIENWKLNTDTSITKADFLNMAPIDPEETYEQILSAAKSVDSNPDGTGECKSLSFLTTRILEENREAFKSSSAAVTMHHNFISGLIYHTFRMLLQALRLCEIYDHIDKELLVCATVLHDIGKISSLKTDDIGVATMTSEGRLLDHALIGVMMVEEEVLKEKSRNNSYDSEKIMMLQHMIASHHGKKEWDAITTPAFPEAELLHLIDMIDSRMNMFEEAYKGVASGTLSADRVYGLENSYIYKPSFVK